MKKYLLTSSFAAGALILLSSCASSNHVAVNHRAYEKTPDCLSSSACRTIAKSNPLTAEAAFHGLWGGSGNVGGKPVDRMDEAFRRHDIVYYESRCGKHLLAADRALVAELKKIDPRTLDPKSRQYRETAISFMQSPFANVVGKPLGVMIQTEEPEGSYFTSPEVVSAFFDPKHPGFPDALAIAEARPRPQRQQQTQSVQTPTRDTAPTPPANMNLVAQQ
jgi:hypothetical protein